MAKTKLIFLNEGPHHGKKVEVDESLKPQEFFEYEGCYYRIVGDYAQFGSRAPEPEAASASLTVSEGGGYAQVPAAKRKKKATTTD